MKCELCRKYEDALSKAYDYNRDLKSYIQRLEACMHKMQDDFRSVRDYEKPIQPYTLKEMLNMKDMLP